MRQTGYYFVTYDGRNEIMRWAKVVDTFNDYKEYWVFEWNGTQFEESELDYISPTPITPEKMAAIEEVTKVVTNVAKGVNTDLRDSFIEINDILLNHKLL